MNLKQLEALIYVARHGTFKQAAEALYFDSSGEDYITPESIQYRIKQLEQELGVAIYRKRQGSSRVTLTREGQLFLREAIEVHGRMIEWKGMFLDSDKGWLTIATTQAVALHRLPEAIVEFRRRHPDLKVRLHNTHSQATEEYVAQGRVDFGLSTRPPEQSELEYVLWKRGNLKLVVPVGHELCTLERVTIQDVARHPLVLLEPEIRGDRELVDEAFRKAGIRRPNVALEASNSEIVLRYVQAGVGVTMVAETAVLRERPGLTTLPLADKLGKTEVGLLVREGQYIPFRAREFLQILDPMFGEWLAEREQRLQHREEPAPAPQPKGRTKT
jgi:LysR family cys regulon transcriptional activator